MKWRTDLTEFRYEISKAAPDYLIVRATLNTTSMTGMASHDNHMTVSCGTCSPVVHV